MIPASVHSRLVSATVSSVTTPLPRCLPSSTV
jgi:hypothetical protein